MLSPLSWTNYKHIEGMMSDMPFRSIDADYYDNRPRNREEEFLCHDMGIDLRRLRSTDTYRLILQMTGLFLDQRERVNHLSNLATDLNLELSIIKDEAVSNFVEVSHGQFRKDLE